MALKRIHQLLVSAIVFIIAVLFFAYQSGAVIMIDWSQIVTDLISGVVIAVIANIAVIIIYRRIYHRGKS